MNEEEQKKKPNGWLKFWEHGRLGIKDYDDNVIISPDLGYTDISELRGETSIAQKDGKWGLIDADGSPYTLFIYDTIVYIGEDCYKGGKRIRPDDGMLVVSYADTHFSYVILDPKGNILCGRDRQYNYVADVYEHEVTVAVNGKCGIIDLEDNIVFDFRYKYIQPMGEGMYQVSYGTEDDYWATIINRNGEVMIPASMKYRSIYKFHNGVARANQDSKWGLIDTRGHRMCDFMYTYVDYMGEGYYKAELGTKKNILRPDGSVVLKEWHNDVFKVQNGFFEFGNTIRKSKDNPKTRYIRGIAHVNGDIIFPMIFERVTGYGDGLFYVEIGTKPYYVTSDGGIYDPERSHLPQSAHVDMKDLFEKFANWVLPGLQFFYRDTDAPVIVDTTYHVGDILRAGFFVDVTTKLLKPAHKTRFLIASAHAAMLCEVDELCQHNPNVKKWNLCTIHFNSYFKVMDVYEKAGVTQVFLLHLPPAAAFFLGHEPTAINFVNEATGREDTLIDMARKSLDEKLTEAVHPRSLDKEFVERMRHPLGLDEEFWPLPLSPADEPTEGDVASMSQMIHKLAQDEDLKDFIKVEDNFPFTGVEGTVCEGCIYAKGIQGHGEGCGRLFIKSFRERYVKGYCEYKKTDLFVPSRFEEKQKYEAKLAKDTAEKQSDVFALNTLRAFIDEKLDGDVRKLRDYDLYSLCDDSKFGDHDLSRANIVKSVMALAFADAWPDLNVDSINHYTYRCSTMNHYQQLFGANILDQFFKGMEKFSPTPEQHQRAVRVAHLIHSIGNIWVVPNKLNDKESLDNYKDASKFKGYMDKYLQVIYGVFTEQKKMDMHMKGIFFKNRKLMADYQGAEGFSRFIQNMMLTDYVDVDGRPKDIFMFVWSMMKDLDRETYFEAVDKFCSFCEEAIPRRADMIIDKLEQVLNK